MQTRIESIIERFCDVATGFIISWLLVQYILPLYGLNIGKIDAAEITIIFTIVSIIRGYVWRRIFNRYTAYKCQNIIYVGKGN